MIKKKIISSRPTNEHKKGKKTQILTLCLILSEITFCSLGSNSLSHLSNIYYLFYSDKTKNSNTMLWGVPKKSALWNLSITKQLYNARECCTVTCQQPHHKACSWPLVSCHLGSLSALRKTQSVLCRFMASHNHTWKRGKLHL